MKRLDLKFGSIKEMLSKDQMKQISGGSCSWQWAGGEDCVGGSTNQAGCQAGADGNCDTNDCCAGVDCNC
jgi:hypothetical protein